MTDYQFRQLIDTLNRLNRTINRLADAVEGKTEEEDEEEGD